MQSSARRLVCACVGSVALGLLFSGASSAAVDSKSVVGAWLFDEGKGDAVKDTSNQGRDGKIRGNAKWVGGKMGGALELDGKGAFLEVPQFGNITPASESTVVVWVKLNGVKNQDLLSLVPLDPGRFTIHFPWGNDIIYQHGNPAEHWAATGLPADTKGNWQHWAFVASGSGGAMRILKNGAEIFKRDTKPAFAARAGSLHLGGRAESSFEGALDEMAVFKVALSAGDISGVMNKGLASLFAPPTAVSPSGKVAAVWGRLKEHK